MMGVCWAGRDLIKTWRIPRTSIDLGKNLRPGLDSKYLDSNLSGSATNTFLELDSN